MHPPLSFACTRTCMTYSEPSLCGQHHSTATPRTRARDEGAQLLVNYRTVDASNTVDAVCAVMSGSHHRKALVRATSCGCREGIVVKRILRRASASDGELAQPGTPIKSRRPRRWPWVLGPLAAVMIIAVAVSTAGTLELAWLSLVTRGDTPLTQRTATATATATATVIPTPTPTATPTPLPGNRAHYLATGCFTHVPAPLPYVVYTGTYLTLHGGSSPMGSQASSLMSCFFQGCCFAPEGGAPAYWTLTPSPGERGSINSGSSGAHLVQSTLLLLPTGTIYRGTGKQH
jgi:hypothetical protein